MIPQSFVLIEGYCGNGPQSHSMQRRYDGHFQFDQRFKGSNSSMVTFLVLPLQISWRSREIPWFRQPPSSQSRELEVCCDWKEGDYTGPMEEKRRYDGCTWKANIILVQNFVLVSLQEAICNRMSMENIYFCMKATKDALEMLWPRQWVFLIKCVYGNQCVLRSVAFTKLSYLWQVIQGKGCWILYLRLLESFLIVSNGQIPGYW